MSASGTRGVNLARAGDPRRQHQGQHPEARRVWASSVCVLRRARTENAEAIARAMAAIAQEGIESDRAAVDIDFAPSPLQRRAKGEGTRSTCESAAGPAGLDHFPKLHASARSRFGGYRARG